MPQPQTIQFSLPPDPNVSYIDTVQAYDQWASIYDGDGNFLQALDSVEMRSLLPLFLSRVETTLQNKDQAVKLIDLGCGTGRNTLQLLQTITTRQADQHENKFENVHIIGLDASRGMLDVAQEAIAKAAPVRHGLDVTLSQVDLLAEPSAQDTFTGSQADGMISTLVLEHIPLTTYFAQASRMLRQGAFFLVTNMHADMGRRSQAGFVDPATNKKVRPTRSYAHEIGDVLAEADRAGFEAVPLGAEDQLVLERAVAEDMLGVLGPRAAKYAGVTVWFAALFRKT